MKTPLRLCAVLLCCLAPALAVDWKALKPQGYVSDFAGVVDPQSKAAIESYATAVKQATGAELAFVTVQSVQGEPIEDVANDLFRAWGIGRKGEDDGALLLLATNDHKSRLEVGGGLGGAVPDGMAGSLLDDMRPALRANQYGPALLVAAERLGSTIAQSKGVTIPNAPATAVRVPRGTRDSIPWPVILFGIFFLILILRRGGGTRPGGGGGSGFWTGLLLGQVLNSGRGYSGGRDGGGFGGYDSGGSGGGFGGFGGGDSGGGGASSGW
jgi:uncharacterized protein